MDSEIKHPVAINTRILCVVGARPNFMKIAPVLRALKGSPHGLTATLLHTGQHYDAAMKAAIFEQLDIPEPDIDLGVGSGTHTQQTAQIMLRFETALDELRPAAVLVVGDVNSTIACALVAAKKSIPVIHVEAGLRSYDRAMPEEINRVLTDQLSDLLFTTERLAHDNLAREGIDAGRIHFVGNVMIDTLRHNLARAVAAAATLRGVAGGERILASTDGFGLVTLHRPSNVDHVDILRRLLTVLREISARLPLVFPLHPRTRANVERLGLGELLESPNIVCLPPQGYLEMLGLMSEARLVLTDSGGIQEETTALGVPCVTLRENTERPITITEGTNTLVGTDADLIRKTAFEILDTGGKAGRIPEYWDGRAAGRIADVIGNWIHADVRRVADR